MCAKHCIVLFNLGFVLPKLFLYFLYFILKFFSSLSIFVKVGKGIVAFNVTAVPNGKLVVTQNGHQSETMNEESIVSR